MALADAMQAMTTAVEDAVEEIRTLTDTIANAVDVPAEVQEATEQLTTLAANLEQAVTEAKSHPDAETPPDETSETPPGETPPGDSPPV